MTNEIEKLVAKFGEEWRDLIANSITWLRNHEHNWGLSKPLDGEAFIEDLLSHESKD